MEPRLVAGDALLQLAHLAGERGLVAHGARHAPQERRDLRARLHEAEDVVDEEQHVLAALVAEVLGHGETGQTDAQTGARRLVHLPEDERRLVDDARFLHLDPQVVALARALAHAAEHREPAVFGGDVVDELLDDDRLADAGAAEEADLAALDVGGEQVDDLDAGLEDLVGGVERLEVGRRAMDGPAVSAFDVVEHVDGLAHHVDDPAEGLLADGHGDGLAGVGGGGAASETVRGVHRHGPHLVVAEVLLDLAHQVQRLAVRALQGDGEGVVDGRQPFGEVHVDHGADHLHHCTSVHLLNSARHRCRRRAPSRRGALPR